MPAVSRAAEEDAYPPLGRCEASPGHTTYHVNPASGDDSAAGTSREQAWKSFRRVNRLRLAPGDRIEIDAPGSFAQTLRITGSGTKEQPLEVRFAPGRYDFHPEGMFRQAYQISNTNDVPDGPKAVAILCTSAKHLRISGNDASIVCRGKLIEACVDHCEDVVIAGLRFDYHRPTVSEFWLESASDGYADVRIHKDSAYSIHDGKIVWQGEGWSYTTGLAQELDLETGSLQRRKNPLANLTCEEIKPHLVRFKGKHDLKPGRVYQLRETRRDCAGVFTQESRDITWRNVTFSFMHGMGMVSQFSENLTFDSVVIAPEKTSGRTTAAWADCLHISGCKGKVLVRNCVFSGAHDDAINVHGTYLRVVDRPGPNQIKVRFMQAQTFGFMAFRKEDEIGFVHSHSLESYAENRVTDVSMTDPKELLLTLEKPVPDGFKAEDVVENITWNPEVEIRGCKVSHIPTRGFLLSSRGKTVVEDNEFTATRMSAISVAGDAMDWFESGGVRDVAIRNNRFIRCGEPVIRIKPSTKLSNPAYHSNIIVENNHFLLAGKSAVDATSTTGLRIVANTFVAGESLNDAQVLRTSDCADVIVRDNIYQLSGK